MGSFGVMAINDMRNPEPVKVDGLRNTTVDWLTIKVAMSGLLPGQYLSIKNKNTHVMKAY